MKMTISTVPVTPTHDMLVTSYDPNMSSHSSTTSPTFFKDIPSKEDTSRHGTKAAGWVSPTSSFDDGMTISTASCASRSTKSDRHTALGGAAFGLPTDYPVHRATSSFNSITLEEELQDFAEFEREIARQGLHTSLPGPFDYNPLQCDTLSASCPDLSPSQVLPRHRRPTHRRQRTELGSMNDLVRIASAQKEKHRNRNKAMGPVDFYETILSKLSEEDFVQ
eukprot:Nitzschia sp. Nitz4//scaffold34_size148208//23073//23738//NITZ4_002961-RA/size148208-processed-gene-0.64-mRNA-1//-1//CDS//3329548738//900//frame0